MDIFKKIILLSFLFFCISPSVSAQPVKWKVLWIIIPETDIQGYERKQMTNTQIQAFRELALDMGNDVISNVREFTGNDNFDFEVTVEVSDIPLKGISNGDPNSRYPNEDKDLGEILDKYAPLREKNYDALIVTADASGVPRQYLAINWGWGTFCPLDGTAENTVNKFGYALQLHEFCHTVERYNNDILKSANINERCASADDGGKFIPNYITPKYNNDDFHKYISKLPRENSGNIRTDEARNIMFYFELLAGTLPEINVTNEPDYVYNGNRIRGADQWIWDMGPTIVKPDISFTFTNTAGQTVTEPMIRQWQTVGKDVKVIFEYSYDVKPENGSNGFIYGYDISPENRLKNCCQGFSNNNIKADGKRKFTIDIAAQRGGQLVADQMYLIGTRLVNDDNSNKNPGYDIHFKVGAVDIDADEAALRTAARAGGEYKLTTDLSNGKKLSAVLEVLQNFTLDLGGHNLTLDVSGAGAIKIAKGKTLTVKDSDAGANTLIAKNNGSGAAINTCEGKIIIESGRINAKGGNRGAGIGSSQHQAGGTIVINGTAIVESEGGQYAPGIGAGADGGGATVIITGGTVRAVGGEGSAGIGSGWGGGKADISASSVEISGGTLTVTGDGAGDDIGKATDAGNHGVIKITGGSVNATRRSVNPQPTNSSQNVYMVTLTLEGINEVTKIANIALPSNYGTNNMQTDASGKLYIWLPSTETNVDIRLTAAGYIYEGVIEAVNSNNLSQATLQRGEKTAVRKKPSERLYGILLESSVVSQTAEISIITPEKAKTTLAVYDNVGNIVFKKDGIDGKVIWNLTNNAGRIVANGSYLVVAEAKSKNGKVYRHSAKLGVSRR